MTGNDCYWWDGYQCWTYKQVQDWWANYYGTAYQDNYYQRLEQAPIQEQMQQAIQVTPKGVSLEWNDILIFASQYWWIGAIFLIGIITISIAGIRIFSKSKWGSELFKMWFGKS